MFDCTLVDWHFSELDRCASARLPNNGEKYVVGTSLRASCMQQRCDQPAGDVGEIGNSKYHILAWIQAVFGPAIECWKTSSKGTSVTLRLCFHSELSWMNNTDWLSLLGRERQQCWTQRSKYFYCNTHCRQLEHSSVQQAV